MSELRLMDAFNEDVADRYGNDKRLRKYLRSAIVESKQKEKSLLKNPKKVTVVVDPEDGPQPTTNKDKANEYKKVRKKATKMLSGMGGGGGSIKALT